jgi:SAM-dependent methyltransferase
MAALALDADSPVLTGARFRAVREAEFARIADQRRTWLASWEGGMENINIHREHKGPEDLIDYMAAWTGSKFAHYFAPNPTLVQASHAVTRRVYERFTGDRRRVPDISNPFPGDRYNAEDFTFQNPYPLPERHRVRRILDFGPGYGRQINIWSQAVPDLVYCGVEAIENGYCVQNAYYRLAGTLPVHEYMDDPDGFVLGIDPGIYHLPTWQAEQLPDDFFDLVIATQVLPELGSPLLAYVLRLFARCLRDGGALYIRDHDLAWIPGHSYDVDAILPTLGFQLEFRPNLIDLKDTHGTPRIWRKTMAPRPVDPNFTGTIKTCLA